jgi:hypothetical protein
MTYRLLILDKVTVRGLPKPFGTSLAAVSQLSVMSAGPRSSSPSRVVMLDDGISDEAVRMYTVESGMRTPKSIALLPLPQAL